jgi:hypothetical protein
MEGRADVLDRFGGKALIELGSVQTLHVGGGEGGKLRSAQGGADVPPHQRAVAGVGRDLHAAAHRVLKPPDEVLF